MKYISLFSGIEAASVAWDNLGWEPVAFSEIEPYPCAVLAHRFPNVPNLGDITQIDWKEVKDKYGTVDVVIGGSPCQSFSVSGGRESLDGESRLMFEYIRACSEITSEWIIWENVPGVLNTKDNAFAQLLDCLQDIGYSLAWRVLDSQFVRIPDRDDNGRIRRWRGPVAQRRRRVFLIGHLGDGGHPAAVLFEQDCLRRNTSSSKEKREKLARAAGIGANAGSYALNRQIIPEGGTARGPVETYALAPTLDASAQAHAVMTQYGEEVAGTLTARNDSSPCADRGQNVLCLQTDHMGQNGTNVSVEVCKTLDLASASPVMCVASGQANAEQTEGFSPTLNCGHDGPPVVCVTDDNANAAIDENMAGTPTANNQKNQPYITLDTQAMPLKGDTTDMVVMGYVVRRLTPKECERLQGFPDDWTSLKGCDIDGVCAHVCSALNDEKEVEKMHKKIEKWERDVPDGPRYKACGNSMTTYVIEWLGRRIEMVNEIAKER